ncbi:MAG: NAD-dependent epimerase/dehydratase family protein [Gemmatimonadetes bacterium]|nr:NAD-dependent epimerase/dehydratase family protein [Gemmatimonadota bacterium]
MREPVLLVTGANGEIGHGLIERIGRDRREKIVALDLTPLDPRLAEFCHESLVGSILDEALLDRLVSRYEFRTIFHLAALLSTRAEFSPRAAHDVNVSGTLNLLQMAADQTEWSGRRVKFLFPSSIAVYGLPDLEEKARADRVREKSWNLPTTMYGCNKIYCEQLGRYYCSYYKQLGAADGVRGVDFRALRFPGLISAVTVPSGGTSDFIPEMLHAVASGQEYACFVREDTRIPFMAMPDAIKALLMLEAASEDSLSWRSYNVTSFNPSAAEFRDELAKRWNDVRVTFEPHLKRQSIVDSWPADVNDDAAREDWAWAPDYDLPRALDDYLVPGMRGRIEAGEGA